LLSCYDDASANGRKLRFTNSYTVFLANSLGDWLEAPHQDKRAARQIRAGFRRAFNLLEQYGTYIGMPYVRKIHGYADLWEIRVSHETGAYRMFFYVHGRAIAVGALAHKTTDDFPASVYKSADASVREFVESNSNQLTGDDER
jgi:phage-related protein